MNEKRIKKHLKSILRSIVCALGALTVLTAQTPNINVQATSANIPLEVIPSGECIGIMMETDGLLVGGINEVKSQSGQMLSPAAEAGILPGDMLTHVNGVKIDNMEHFSRLVEASEKSPVEISLIRGADSKTVYLTPVKDTVGETKIGVWLRDHTTGLGTLTFIDPATGNYGALGHAIADNVSGVILPVKSGKITRVSVTGAIKGISGAPGELQGSFSAFGEVGRISNNTYCGLYGKITDKSYFKSATVPVGKSSEVHVGKAQIISTVGDSGTKIYDISIEKICVPLSRGEKNMIIRVTDEELLSLTGGIVQGMSGSPIIQDGKIIGAVTHVLVNDPTRGYGIFIENMLNAVA